MKEGFFVHKRKAKICKSISQEKRQRFAKVFLKKRQRFAKVFKYSSIQKKYSNCFGSFQGDKKDMQDQNISFYLRQNCNDINGDLNTCGLHCPSTTEPQVQRRGELGQAKQGWVVCVSTAQLHLEHPASSDYPSLLRLSEFFQFM